MTEIAIEREGAERMGFFTDTTVCIGCKACEVACKQWNDLPADGSEFVKGGSYDNTRRLSGNTWRHVRFVELAEAGGGASAEDIPNLVALATRNVAEGERDEGAARLAGETDLERDEARLAGETKFGERDEGAARLAGETDIERDEARLAGETEFGERDEGAARLAGETDLERDEARLAGETDLVEGAVDVAAAIAMFDNWVFMSDVCKHCTNAGCLDACPTGALIRTEFETVVLQPDVCNGCGYCVPACPFGVVDRVHEDGRAGKCTLCYDRLEDGLEPACAKACPTDSIQFGPYDELVEVAQRRVSTLHGRGVQRAYLYGAADAPEDELAGGLGAFFLLTEPPERYGLPAHAESPIQENVVPATLAAMGAGLLAAAGVAAAFLWERTR
jgi:formate dehydrogenase iron-sulfur subunit